jgi:hypothetical protein
LCSLDEAKRNPGSPSALAKIVIVRMVASAPIVRQYAGPDVSMQCREWPFTGRRDQSMLDRVEMNIVHASFEILIVAYRVLPETSLPKQILATVISENGPG